LQTVTWIATANEIELTIGVLAMKRILRLSVFSAATLITLFAQGKRAAGTREYFAYFGTYTRQDSKGIYAYRFQPATGKLTPVGLVGETENPSFLTLHPNQRFLYAVNEISNYQGESSGSVTAFSIDAKTGNLTLLNRVSAHGTTTCHLVADKTGKCLLVANYGTGVSVAAFPISADGSLGEASAMVRHTGSSIGPRQKGPHAHSVNLSPDNRFVLVPDLGLDQVFSYRLDPAQGTLTPDDPAFATVTKGSGPRHFAFHPNGHFAYVLSEMGSLVSVLAYDSAGGTMNELQTISTLPKDYDGTNNSAEVFVHPNGRFLYASNRGHDSIAVFAIDPRKGTLTSIEQVSTNGKTPRGFAIDPTGAYLLAANQNTNDAVLFRVDQKTGRLTLDGDDLKIPSPVCVIFVPAQ
jgi:6-phosphogluconolactonase